MDDLAVARIAVSLVACLHFGVFLVFYWVIIRYAENATKRVSFGTLCIITLMTVFFCQFKVYQFFSHVTKPIDRDAFFFWLVVLEWSVPTLILLVLLLRSRKNNSSSNRLA